MHGGLAQGIAQALYEGAPRLLRAEGNLLTASMGDYLLPSASDRPLFVTDRTVTRCRPPPPGHAGDPARPARSRRPRRSSTASSTRFATSASTTSSCRPARRTSGEPSRRRRGDRHDPPRPSTNVKASTVDEALAALRRRVRTPGVGGGQSLLPVLRLRLNAPSVLVDVSGVDEIRLEHQRRGRRAAHRRGGHHARDPQRRRRQGLGAAARADRGRRRRPGHPPPWHVRRLVHPRRPRGRHAHGGAGARRRVRDRGRGGSPYRRCGGLLRRRLTTAVGPDEVLVAVRVPKLEGWGTHYENVPPHRPGLGDRRRRRGR